MALFILYFIGYREELDLVPAPQAGEGVRHNKPLTTVLTVAVKVRESAWVAGRAEKLSYMLILKGLDN